MTNPKCRNFSTINIKYVRGILIWEQTYYHTHTYTLKEIFETVKYFSKLLVHINHNISVIHSHENNCQIKQKKKCIYPIYLLTRVAFWWIPKIKPKPSSYSLSRVKSQPQQHFNATDSLTSSLSFQYDDNDENSKAKEQ